MATLGSLRTLRWLAVAVLGSAAIVAIGAALPFSSPGLLLVALALVLVAAAIWRLSRTVALSTQDSQAWSEVGVLRSALAKREVLWSDLPTAAAAWGADGELIVATATWRRLGVPLDAPPNKPELEVGDAARRFVVETNKANGARLVVLREVTRERQALEAKDELLAIVGHELRTPLSSIKGYGQLMARQLATVQEQVQRLDQLIEEILDTASADSGRLNLRREPLSVTDLVTSATERLRAARPERKVETSLRGEALIEGDAARLGQVLDNLLSNAAKYSPADSTIAVRSSLDGGLVYIAISDSGRGIAAEHMPLLFDRFYRVPGTEAGGPQGFGLGLSIVRDLVEAHRGRVDVASEGPGKGATFTVALPVALALQTVEPL